MKLFKSIKGILLQILGVLSIVQYSSGANIFLFQVIASYSHRISIWPLLEDLTKAGHNVTVISSYVNKNPDPKIHEYVPKLWHKVLEDGGGDWNGVLDFFDMRNRGQVTRLWTEALEFGIVMCEMLYEDDEFLKWFGSLERPDLVIMDAVFNECVFGMVHHWKTKLVVFSTLNVMGWCHDQYGLPDETSSVPDVMFGFPPGTHMTFWQRFTNAMTALFWKVYREWYHFPRLEAISRKGLMKLTGKDVDLPPFTDIEKNTSLTFVSAHHSMSFPRSFPPNIIPIGGNVVGGSNKVTPLPKDLAEFIGNDGFVYVSLGSITEFTLLPQKLQDAFVNAINAFPKTKFIWKVHKAINSSLPLKHVKFANWVPQVSLLAHPKITGFITHAGLGSTSEAIVHGVPVVMFPYFADQDSNARFIEHNGGGKIMEITQIDEKEMQENIREITENPKYKQAMKKLSVLFKDRQTTPQKTALWWTEFVLRHDNTFEFLRPPSVEQSWYVKRQLDVWFVAQIIVLLVTVLPIYVLIKIVKMCTKSKRKASTKIKNKKND